MTARTPNPDHEQPPDGGDRLQRIEEAMGFAEHEQEQLGQQVARLQQQVQALSQRVVQLEGRLERFTRTGPERQNADPDDDAG